MKFIKFNKITKDLVYIESSNLTLSLDILTPSDLKTTFKFDPK